MYLNKDKYNYLYLGLKIKYNKLRRGKEGKIIM